METHSPDLTRFSKAIANLNPLSVTGKVVQVIP